MGARMKHTVEQAVELQRRFEESVPAHSKGIIGIGISLNESRDDLAINVQVDRSEAANALPRQFDGIDVVVDVVGQIRTY